MAAPLHPPALTIRAICLDGTAVTLVAQSSAPHGRCPSCGVISTAAHDRYQRRPQDLPWRGHPVRLQIRVRRFRCANPRCERRTFAEDFGAALPRRAHRTAAATAVLLRFAELVGGEAGARLAQTSGLPVSPDTLLRLLRQSALPPPATPRVLGVDDLALRRGHRYGTILVDLDTHRPIDLLMGREAEVLAQWLRDHPGVEVIARDRSEAYAEGIRQGAPDATQVADRFHLVQNASAALDEVLRGRRRRVEIATTVNGASDPPAPLPPAAMAEERPLSRTKQQALARRAVRVARWQRVRELHSYGVSIRRIATEVSLDRKTVRRLLATPEPPRNRVEHPRPGGLTSPMLQPFVTYLQDRWQQGCQNISRLYREIATQGYQGSRSLLAQALLAWRPPRPPPGQRRQVRRLSVRWLCLRPPAQLDAEEQRVLANVLADDPDLARGYTLLQRFRALIADRDVSTLDAWLRDAQTSGLASFMALATGILADRAAAEAALRLPYSTGSVEGHVHRVKLIKRQGYGRAKLDLLRRRVLAA